MTTSVPVTVWRDTPGNKEMGSAGSVLITTLALVQLVTLAGVSLLTLAGSYTDKPATVWTQDDGS